MSDINQATLLQRLEALEVEVAELRKAVDDPNRVVRALDTIQRERHMAMLGRLIKGAKSVKEQGDG